LSYVFNSSLFEFQSGSFLTSTVNQLTTSNLYSFEVPVPPNEEQFAIASFLDRETSRIDTLISEAKKFIDLLKEYRSSLITAAVTGKIDVREVVPSGSEKREIAHE
jgi:type I restriction enzyme S subunit